MPIFARSYVGVRPVVGLAISLALHALVFTLGFTHLGAPTDKPDPPARKQKLTVLYIRPPEKSVPEPEPAPPKAKALAVPLPPIPVPEVMSLVEPVTPRQPASMAAPPVPTAAECKRPAIPFLTALDQ
jgi:hypothetical protein